MTRRRTVAALLTLLVGTVALPGAASATEAQATTRVRAAIPAISVYHAEHGTYVGLTLAKIRAYDGSVRSIAVKRATRTTYCIQSTLAGPVVHFDGPKGPVRRGPCGVSGAVVPQPGHGLTTDPAAAKRALQNAVFAIETYAGGSGSYAGLTLAKLQAIDASVRGIRVIWSTVRSYCIESGIEVALQHLRGPDRGVAAGRCPTAP